MIKKIDFFTFASIYDACRVFTEDFAKALQRKGVRCRLFDCSQAEMSSYMWDVLQDPPDCTFTITCKGSSEGTFFCDMFDIPHFIYLVDASIYFLPALKKPHLHVSCIDAHDCELLTKLHFDNHFFLPHAAGREMNYEEGAERPYEVSLIGGIFDCEQLREKWLANLPAEVMRAIDRVADIVLSDHHSYFATLFLEEMLSIGWHENQELISLLMEVEGYIRTLERLNVVRAIKDAKVHLFGPKFYGNSGWQEYLGGLPNVVIHPAVSFEESFKIMQQSKILLNCTPSYKGGAHERIFNGLAFGSLVAAGPGLFVPACFEDGKELLLYQPRAYEELSVKINYYLAHEDERCEIVFKGREKVMREHTWDQRATLFLEKFPFY